MPVHVYLSCMLLVNNVIGQQTQQQLVSVSTTDHCFYDNNTTYNIYIDSLFSSLDIYFSLPMFPCSRSPISWAVHEY